MHPDVPRWAREVLEREVDDVDFTHFHVLKDGAVQKLAVGHTPRETFIVQRTPAGGEIYRIAGETLAAVAGNGHADPDGTAEVVCGSCDTTFRYWRDGDGDHRPVYCFNCGASAGESVPGMNGNGREKPAARAR